MFLMLTESDLAPLCFIAQSSVPISSPDIDDSPDK